MSAHAPRWPQTDRIKLGILGLMFALVMGGPWVGGFFGDANIAFEAEGTLQEGVVRAFPGCQGFGCETVGGRTAGRCRLPIR